MATQTRPHVKLTAALASAAVIAAATPVVSPQVSLPSPTALSSAAYDLTTFEDVLTIPLDEWTDLLFFNAAWGNYVGNKQETGLVIDPYGGDCDAKGGCFVSGPSGALYLFLDALINGAYYDSTIDPETGKPFGLQPATNAEGLKVTNWLNYLFEPFFVFAYGSGTSSSTIQDVAAGLSAASQYLIQATIGGCTPVENGGGPCVPPSEMPYVNAGYVDPPFPDPGALVYPNPIGQLTWAAYLSTYLVTLGWTRSLQNIAELAWNLPVVGPYIYGTILSYTGDLLSPSANADGLGLFYGPGLSGPLQFWINVLGGVYANGFPSPPFPPAPATAASVKATGAPVEVTSAEPATTADIVADAVAPAGEVQADVAAEPSAEPTADAVRETTAADSAPAQPADEPTDSTVDSPADSTADGTADSTADSAGAEATAAPAADPRAAAEKAPRRGLRGALDKATAKISSGVERAKAGAATGRSAAAAE